ncbi:hypothetical protein BDY21DRAFT_424916 [Lineolata rhizophorae]|uniref:Uncharacterized protein n=1 Tax=Lineolata rhizophorae TaxID=578093 RepID=A0A6A6NLY8_9PEZI|nr:hypothetical protein BDY21DRAFT_424916 [Lineolata rhizophorae]
MIGSCDATPCLDLISTTCYILHTTYGRVSTGKRESASVRRRDWRERLRGEMSHCGRARPASPPVLESGTWQQHLGRRRMATGLFTMRPLVTGRLSEGSLFGATLGPRGHMANGSTGQQLSTEEAGRHPAAMEMSSRGMLEEIPRAGAGAGGRRDPAQILQGGGRPGAGAADHPRASGARSRPRPGLGWERALLLLPPACQASSQSRPVERAGGAGALAPRAGRRMYIVRIESLRRSTLPQCRTPEPGVHEARGLLVHGRTRDTVVSAARVLLPHGQGHHHRGPS